MTGAKPQRARRRLLLGAAALVLSAACSGGDGGAGSAGTGTQPDEGPGSTGAGDSSGAQIPDVPTASVAGSGTIVVGATTSPFTVTACRLEADPADPPAAQTLVAVVGAGTSASGGPFTVEIRRFATGTDVVTYTDTIAYSDSARILQAQRIEVKGQVTDLRDPSARAPLIQARADGVAAAGLAGAPGDLAGDGGIIGVALDATCP
jgi:hypothetical protein